MPESSVCKKSWTELFVENIVKEANDFNSLSGRISTFVSAYASAISFLRPFAVEAAEETVVAWDAIVTAVTSLTSLVTGGGQLGAWIEATVGPVIDTEVEGAVGALLGETAVAAIAEFALGVAAIFLLKVGAEATVEYNDQSSKAPETFDLSNPSVASGFPKPPTEGVTAYLGTYLEAGESRRAGILLSTTGLLTGATIHDKEIDCVEQVILTKFADGLASIKWRVFPKTKGRLDESTQEIYEGVCGGGGCAFG